MKVAAFMLQTFGRVGVLGLSGFAGFLVWLIVFIVFAVILFNILKLVIPKVVGDATWQQVIYWLAVLLAFVLFLHFVGLY